MLGGASAGAASITLQLVAYGGRDDGLFHATAAESQAFAAIRTVAESQYQYNELADRTKCSSKGKCKEEIFKCLQDLDIVKLHKANIRTKFPGTDQVPIFAYNPCLDNDFIQSYTYDLFNSGKFVKLPAIYGYLNTPPPFLNT